MAKVSAKMLTARLETQSTDWSITFRSLCPAESFCGAGRKRAESDQVFPLRRRCVSTKTVERSEPVR